MPPVSPHQFFVEPGKQITYLVVHAGPVPASAAPIERLSNEKVSAREYTIRPGATAYVDGCHPAAIVYFSGSSVKRGEVVFVPASGEAAAPIKNTGSEELHFVRTEFLTPGVQETWGPAGLSPDYKMRFELKCLSLIP